VKTLLALLIALCAAAPAGAQTRQSPAAPKVLRVAFSAAETSFDPAAIFDLYSRTITSHVFEALYAYDHLARPIKIRPLTAAALPEVSADFRTWTVKLRPGIYFADDPAFKGQRRELVAQDYVYAIKRFVDPAIKSPVLSNVLDTTIVGLPELRDKALKNKQPFDYGREIGGLKALDRYTIRFRLEKPRPRFLEWLAQSDLFGAVAREVVESYGGDIGAHPVGTGPFRLKQWRRSSLIVLERNPQFREMHYDAEPASDDAQGQALLAQFKGRRVPMVDEVDIAIVEENQPRWLAFLNGQTDMIGTTAAPLPPQYIDVAVPGGKLLPGLAKRGVRAYRVVNPDVAFTMFNMEDPVVGGYTPEKVALRRAISLAYDSEREIRLVRKGQGVPAQSRVMPDTSGYDPTYKSEMSEYDRARAKALLDMYGYVDRDGDGWRDLPDGSPLLLHMATQPDQRSRQYSEEWKRNLGAVGIRIDFVPQQWPENLKAVRAGKLMMWQLGVSAAGPDGQDALSSMYGPEIGGQNMARFKMPAFDALYERMSEIEDGPEREALFLQAKKLATAYMPYKARLHTVETDLVYPWLLGYRRTVFWQEWWHMVDIDSELRARSVKQ
jgi:ABC-type transport system substrate-binding protein